MSIESAKLNFVAGDFKVTGRYFTLPDDTGKITLLPTLSSEARLSFALIRSTITQKGFSLKNIRLTFSIEDASLTSITTALEVLESTTSGTVVSPIASSLSGSGTTVGDYVATVTVTSPSFDNDPDSRVYRLIMTLVNNTANIVNVILKSAEVNYDIDIVDSLNGDIDAADANLENLDGTIDITPDGNARWGMTGAVTGYKVCRSRFDCICCKPAGIFYEDLGVPAGPLDPPEYGVKSWRLRGFAKHPREPSKDEAGFGVPVGYETFYFKIKDPDASPGLLIQDLLGLGYPASYVSGACHIQTNNSTTLCQFGLIPSNQAYCICDSLDTELAPHLLRSQDNTMVQDNDYNSPIDIYNYLMEQSVNLGLHNIYFPTGNPFSGNIDAALDQIKLIRDTGVTHNTNIAAVRKTVASSGVTTIITSTYHWVNQASVVTLSGFDATNGWNTYNGNTYPVVYYQLTGIRPLANHVNVATYEYYVTIELDSSARASNTFGGAAQISVTHGPVVHASSHRELCAALLDARSAITGGSHPCGLGVDMSREQGSDIVFDSWNDYQTALSSSVVVRQICKYQTPPVASTFYHNPSPKTPIFNVNDDIQLNENIYGNIYDYLPYPINDPNINGSNVIASGLYDYNIVMSNYIVDANYLWYEITGPTDTLLQQISGGSDFNYMMSPTSPGASWKIYQGEIKAAHGSDDDDIRNAMFIGRINPALVGGDNIGYIRLRDFYNIDTDDFLYFDEWKGTTWDPYDSTPPADKRQAHRPNQIKAIGALMTKLLSLGANMDKIIIDLRHYNSTLAYYFLGTENESLEMFTSLAECFGSNRLGSSWYIFLQNSGTLAGSRLPSVALSSLSTYRDLSGTSAASVGTIDTDAMATQFPNAMYRGAGKKVVFLTSTQSSESELLVRMFLGDALNKNIGSGVTTFIVGDNVGSTNVNFGSYVSHPVSQIASKLIYNSDIGENYPCATVFVEDDNSSVGQIPVGSWQDEPLSALQPDLLLDNKFENVVYEDVGITGPYTDGALLLGPGGAYNTKVDPINGTNTTWRDRWLENAIVNV
jgi:hypothetical protein